jgi:hypothetical protein
VVPVIDRIGPAAAARGLKSVTVGGRKEVTVKVLHLCYEAPSTEASASMGPR